MDQKSKRSLVTVVGLILLIMVAVPFLFQQAFCKGSQVRSRVIGQVNELSVPAGGDLQAAIKLAHYGDTIVLQAGAIYRGPLMLPDKGPGNADNTPYITIRTSNLAGIAKEGNRVNPSQASSMPKIVSPTNLVAVGTEPQAHHYRFIGIEFSPAADASYVYNLIDLGGSDYNTLSQFPHHITFDRCYVHSTGLNKARRGFALNSAETSVLNSYVSGFAGEGDETQAVAGWNGPGPFHIVNNFLQGGAEVLLFGGGDPSIPNLVPSDIEIRRNYFHKPAEWQGKATVKGTLELKNARHVVIDGNLLENEIRVTALVITVRNQNSKAPWSVIEDVQITNNIGRRDGTGINLLGQDTYAPSKETNRVTIANNLFEDVAVENEIAYFLQISGTDFTTVEHNTVQQAGNMMTAYGQPARHFVFRNNIIQYNLYGINCSVQAPTCPNVAFCNCFPGGMIHGNVIADKKNVSASYPIKDFPGNFITPSFNAVGFVDYVRGSWELRRESGYRGKGTDGKDPGVDFVKLNASGVRSAKDGIASAN